jgi:hypothetical protein
MRTRALSLIESTEYLRASVASDPLLDVRIKSLQRWQAERIASTYADCASESRYLAALQFFMNDLYGLHDSLQRTRNLDITKVLHRWERVLPGRAHDALLYALELEGLSLSLDIAVARALDADVIDEPSYARAYRKANRRTDRQRQIWLIVACGRALDRLVQLPAIGLALRVARVPARLAGVAALQSFLERGYAAFAAMHGAADLLRIIENRETVIMQRLFAGSASPLSLPVPPRQELPLTRRPG